MKKILLSLAAAAMCLSANAAWYVVGSFNGWDAANAVEMTEEAPGYYQLDLPEMTTSFKIIGQQSWDGQILAAPGDAEPLEVNSEAGYALTLEAGNNIDFKDLDKIKDVTVGLKVEGETYTLYVFGEAVYEMPVLYLTGSPFSWGLTDECLMTQNGNIYSLTCALDVTLDAPHYLKIAAKDWTTQWGWYTYPEHHLSLEYPITSVEKRKSTDPEAVAVAISEAGEYTFFFDYEESTLTMTKASGIESIDVDNNVAPVYYNLQGVRVNNPENGLFIKVAGKNVSKVVL